MFINFILPKHKVQLHFNQIYIYIFTIICKDLWPLYNLALFNTFWVNIHRFWCESVFNEFLNLVFIIEHFPHQSVLQQPKNVTIGWCNIRQVGKNWTIEFQNFLLCYSCCMQPCIVMEEEEEENIFLLIHCVCCHCQAELSYVSMLQIYS